jgi:hypothetical protein
MDLGDSLVSENTELLRQLYEKVLALATENATLIKRVLTLLQGSIEGGTGLKGLVDDHEKWIKRHERLQPLDDISPAVKILTELGEILPALQVITENREWVIKAAEAAEKRNKLYWIGITSIVANLIGLIFWISKATGG